MGSRFSSLQYFVDHALLLRVIATAQRQGLWMTAEVEAELDRDMVLAGNQDRAKLEQRRVSAHGHLGLAHLAAAPEHASRTEKAARPTFAQSVVNSCSQAIKGGGAGA